MLLGVTACADDGTDLDPTERDDDLDGYAEVDGDCDDFNNTRSPVLLEVPGDGVDQNCDGLDQPVDPATTDVDRDGQSGLAGDCDDFNNRVYAGAIEIPGDGIDQDCDGADTPGTPGTPDDADGDTFTVAAGDCDDTNSAVYPGARERSGDGLDSNCDESETPMLGENLYEQALGIMDTDTDGAISFDEFTTHCETSANLAGGRPGVVEVHVSCGGTNSCAGMIYHDWLEVFAHDCRGINGCAGWSCVETAEGSGQDGATVFQTANCAWCHTGEMDGQLAFKVKVPPGEDLDDYTATFLERSDEEFRTAIAFGIQGFGPHEEAYRNMPGYYAMLSRAEMDAVIAYLRTLPLEASAIEYPIPTPDE